MAARVEHRAGARVAAGGSSRHRFVERVALSTLSYRCGRRARWGHRERRRVAQPVVHRSRARPGAAAAAAEEEEEGYKTNTRAQRRRHAGARWFVPVSSPSSCGVWRRGVLMCGAPDVAMVGEVRDGRRSPRTSRLSARSGA